MPTHARGIQLGHEDGYLIKGKEEVVVGKGENENVNKGREMRNFKGGVTKQTCGEGEEMFDTNQIG